MKRLISIIFSLIVLTGCSYKDNILQIEPYKTNNTLTYIKPKKIYIKSIEDKRANKDIIAIITNSKGDNLGYYISNINFIKWYQDALKKAFKTNNIKIVNSPNKADKTIHLQIENISSTFNKNILTKANLFGYIELKLTIKKTNQTITKKISEHIQNYVPIFVTKKDFKKEIETLLKDSIKMIIKGLGF